MRRQCLTVCMTEYIKRHPYPCLSGFGLCHTRFQDGERQCVIVEIYKILLDLFWNLFTIFHAGLLLLYRILGNGFQSITFGIFISFPICSLIFCQETNQE